MDREVGHRWFVRIDDAATRIRPRPRRFLATHEIRFYLDGAPAGVASYSGRSVAAVSGDLWLGTYDGTDRADYALHGALSDLRWFRHALTPAQIGSLACGE
ncbi:MAG: LamG-like jellyroll fold domain-containing protein [Kofleriaceae bacterium]